MVKVTALICFLMSSSVFAFSNNYDLKMELSINGKHISSPRVIVKEGATASIIQDSNGQKTFIDIVATEDTEDNSKSAILMKFVVGTLSDSGERTVLSTPRIVAFENQKAEITQGKDQESLSLSVIAIRKTF